MKTKSIDAAVDGFRCLTPPAFQFEGVTMRRRIGWAWFAGIGLFGALTSVNLSESFADAARQGTDLPSVVARQPEPARRQLAANLHEILNTFSAAGIKMSQADLNVLEKVPAKPDDAALQAMQAVLDHYALLDVNITDEAWFVLHPAADTPSGRPLVKGRWGTYLIKVRNDSRVTSPFDIRSDQGLYEAADPAGHLSATCQPQTHGWAQWFKLHMVGPPLMQARLSGTEVEYFVVQICSLDSGDRAAELTLYLGGGLVSQGHYGSLSLLFHPEEPPQ